MVGSWGGEFFGNAAVQVDVANAPPTSVAGAFDAAWGSAQPVRTPIVMGDDGLARHHFSG